MIDLRLAIYMSKAGNLHIRILFRKVILKAYLPVVGELEQLGFYDIFLWVLEDNLRARRFYERAGFISTENYLDDTIGGKELREIQYCRSVK